MTTPFSVGRHPTHDELELRLKDWHVTGLKVVDAVGGPHEHTLENLQRLAELRHAHVWQTRTTKEARKERRMVTVAGGSAVPSVQTFQVIRDVRTNQVSGF